MPLHLLTDSKSRFNILIKGTRTSEKRLMLHVYEACEGYKAKAICNVGFVRTDQNLVDRLTKPRTQSATYSLICTAKHTTKVEQWIL